MSSNSKMIKGVMTILKKVKDKSDREEIVDDMVRQFEREKIQFNKEDFIKRIMIAKSGGTIPERYKEAGFTKTGVKKTSTNPNKKWMVLAEKNGKFKIVHGGYKGMEDYAEHKDENRRDSFWKRMGGKDSEKTKDVFSPLHWHKKFGTW